MNNPASLTGTISGRWSAQVSDKPLSLIRGMRAHESEGDFVPLFAAWKIRCPEGIEPQMLRMTWRGTNASATDEGAVKAGHTSLVARKRR